MCWVDSTRSFELLYLLKTCYYFENSQEYYLPSDRKIQTLMDSPKVTPPISFHRNYYRYREYIAPLDRASYQLQKRIFSITHYDWLCIFVSNEHEPACQCHKNLHLNWQFTFSLQHCQESVIQTISVCDRNRPNHICNLVVFKVK